MTDGLPINFRDAGGLPAAGGRTVSRDRLFRSGHMAGLNADAAARMASIDFAVIVDLRVPQERERHPSAWPGPILPRILAHGGSGARDAPHLSLMRQALAGEADVKNAYRSFYAGLPFDTHYRPLFAEALTRIAMTGGPALIHCSAGKDRTGTLVGLLLSLLGVADDDVVAEYLRSADAPGLGKVRDDIHQRHPALPAAALDALVGVRPDYILAALRAVRQTSGSVERYFLDAGVAPAAIERFRQSLLHAAPMAVG